MTDGVKLATGAIVMAAFFHSAQIYADVRIWVTSNTYNGSFHSDASLVRSFVDFKCAADSNRPDTTTNVAALISLSENDEIRDLPQLKGIPTNEPIYRSDGTTQIAANWSDLLTGDSTNSITENELRPWTFSNTGAGGIFGTQTCNGGTDFTNNFWGKIGSTTDKASWAGRYGTGCASIYPLYCISWSQPVLPTLTLADLSYTENDPATPIDSAATANNDDGDAVWDSGAKLEAQITANNEAADELSIKNSGTASG
ncbi:MAG: hypothetical protein HQL48_00875, partial [Gammaproteobacteria bacterium]|nr:hypothetical protein [Gammaproteobacteria bacterium]